MSPLVTVHGLEVGRSLLAADGGPAEQDERGGVVHVTLAAGVTDAARRLARGEAATLTGQDLDGTELRYEATGWFARMLQHEYDHLNGFLYVDRLQGRWARRAKKAVKAHGWGVPGLSWMPGEDRDPFGHDDETPEDERSD